MKELLKKMLGSLSIQKNLYKTVNEGLAIMEEFLDGLSHLRRQTLAAHQTQCKVQQPPQTFAKVSIAKISERDHKKRAAYLIVDEDQGRKRREEKAE